MDARIGKPALAALTATLLVFTGDACDSGRCRIGLGQESTSPEWVSVFSYCRQPAESRIPSSVQILIDASGSMNGFGEALREIQPWLHQSLGFLMGAEIELKSFRGCSFSQSIGIGSCTHSLGSATPAVSPRGETNLHEALLSSADYDLSVVLTDGVAFTGLGTGDCAGGVDAACVARSLEEVISIFSLSTPEGDVPGVWVMPMVAQFRGVFYSEQRISSAAFAAAQVRERVRAETRQPVEITSPQNSSAGYLHYNYRGPKVLILIVLARSANVGRAYLANLWNLARHAGIQRMETWTWGGALAAAAPVELLPGAVPMLAWERDSVLRRCPPIDVLFTGESIEVGCPAGRESQVHLALTAGGSSQLPQCLPVGLVSPLRAEMTSGRVQTGLLQAQRLKISEGRLELLLTCGATADSCPASGPTHQWVVRPDFSKGAECLATGACDNAAGLVASISTERPADEPHKAFGIGAALREFLLRAGNSARPIPVATLGVCVH